MSGLRIPRAHSDSWYDNLAATQPGYFYPWESRLASRNGNDAFIELVHEYITSDSQVLEVGCGHGELALALAHDAGHITAYDRVGAYIELAESRKGDLPITFLAYNMLDPSHEEELPVAAASQDVIICRLGPLHWISDARRVCKPGGWLIGLSPMEEPIPAWSSKLPHRMHYENSGRHSGSGSIHHSVENRLHQAGLTLHSGWSFDVPEVFATPESLYTMVTWGLPADEKPSWDDIGYKFESIFETYAEPDGIHLRHCRYLWLAQVPA